MSEVSVLVVEGVDWFNSRGGISMLSDTLRSPSSGIISNTKTDRGYQDMKCVTYTVDLAVIFISCSRVTLLHSLVYS